MKTAVLHDIGNAPLHCQYLAQALRIAWERKSTGYIVTPADEIINLKNGKRKSADGKRWVPCNFGL